MPPSTAVSGWAGARPWRDAAAAALYGHGGFYSRGERPDRHFRTSVHASGLFADALLELLRRVDGALGRPDPLDLVDVGAGRGELLQQMWEAADPELRRRLRLSAVERAPRPELPAAVGWLDSVPRLTGLLLANEWLDNLPVEVVQQTDAGPRVVTVDWRGRESLGALPSTGDLEWLDQWWPAPRPGDRREVGSARDAAWAEAVRQVRRGVAVAIDYGHLRELRPAGGTLSGYRYGRPVTPVPDGSCDLTAHVALDACAAAGERAGASGTLLTSQRSALQQLGVSGHRPALDQANADPAGYLLALQRASEAAELTAPAGLGGFGWLVQAVHVPLPLK